tara:strand:+ start:162 stop:512 length:351 start_codon:yes stop_codon:yes gene_type:complete
MREMLKVVKDFHPYPAGRYPEDGPGNGTTFRELHLVPAIKRGNHLTIDLDGAPGYPSSFLEEAFGGLIRAGIEQKTIRELLEFQAVQPGFSRYIGKIWEHIDRAASLVKAGQKQPT